MHFSGGNNRLPYEMAELLHKYVPSVQTIGGYAVSF